MAYSFVHEMFDTTAIKIARINIKFFMFLFFFYNYEINTNI
jgi:hypothetical protein